MTGLTVHQKKKADSKEVLESLDKLTADQKNKILYMIKGILLIAEDDKDEQPA